MKWKCLWDKWHLLLIVPTVQVVSLGQKKNHQHNVWANMPSRPRWLQPSQNPGIWLSLWNASLRHRSLFTVLIKWKAWSNWGESGILRCVCVCVCGEERLGDVTCSCNDVFGTPWLVNASSKLSLSRGEQFTLGMYILFAPCFLPTVSMLICPEDLWGWKGWEMAGRRCVSSQRNGWGRPWLPWLKVQEAQKRIALDTVYKQKAEWIKVASL